MSAGDVVNRKLLVVVAVAAVAALLAGAAVGRNLLSSSSTTTSPHADVVRFKDEVSKVSIDYPASWARLEQPDDPEVALRVAANTSASLLMRVSAVGFAPVTRKQLPIVRKFTDELIATDPRATQLVAPVPVTLGGLTGWRYRYTFGSGDAGGAHDHYFLFKDGRMIQLVFQASPAERLPALAPTFDNIAATFEGRVR
jgi:hypothetical protein